MVERAAGLPRWGILDTACVKVALGQNAVPAALERLCAEDLALARETASFVCA
jgi:hypothetical protein